MSNEADALSCIYAYILSDQWGRNNLTKNQNASPAAANDQSWQLTIGTEMPHSEITIHDEESGGGKQ